MEALPLIARKPKRRRALFLLLALCAPLAGCVTLSSFCGPKDVPPTGPVHQVHTAWENRLVVTVDCVNNGAPLPGLAGRLYLFGPEVGFPLKGEGAVVVEAFDISSGEAGGEPKPITPWVIDKHTLQRLLHKDMIGWGYTLFLPWTDYRPEITRLKLVVRYVPENGTPIYAPHATVTLAGREASPTVSRQTIVPGQQAVTRK